MYIYLYVCIQLKSIVMIRGMRIKFKSAQREFLFIIYVQRFSHKFGNIFGHCPVILDIRTYDHTK